MQIKEVMTKTPHYMDPGTTVREVAKKMRDEECGAILIGENDRLTGVVTDRDIVLRCIAEGKDAERCTAKDVMSPNLFYCFEDQTLEEAVKLMEQNKVRRLAVLNRDKRLTGVISLSDIALAEENAPLVNKVAQFASKQAAA